MNKLKVLGSRVQLGFMAAAAAVSIGAALPASANNIAPGKYVVPDVTIMEDYTNAIVAIAITVAGGLTGVTMLQRLRSSS